MCDLRPAASVAVRRGSTSLYIGKPPISSKRQSWRFGAVDENSLGPLHRREPRTLRSYSRRALPRCSPRGGAGEGRRARGVGARRGGDPASRDGRAAPAPSPLQGAGRGQRGHRPLSLGSAPPPRPGRAGVGRGGMFAVPWQGLRGTPRRASRR